VKEVNYLNKKQLIYWSVGLSLISVFFSIIFDFYIFQLFINFTNSTFNIFFAARLHIIELNFIRWFPLLFIPVFIKINIKRNTILRLFLTVITSIMFLVFFAFLLVPYIPNQMVSPLLPKELRTQPFLYWIHFIIIGILIPIIFFRKKKKSIKTV
jgi:hypothetical protein